MIEKKAAALLPHSKAGCARRMSKLESQILIKVCADSLPRFCRPPRQAWKPNPQRLSSVGSLSTSLDKLVSGTSVLHFAGIWQRELCGTRVRPQEVGDGEKLQRPV